MALSIRSRLGILFTGLASLLLIAASQPTTHSDDKLPFKEETYATGLDSPWGMAFLPDGRMLVTEKIGNLRIVNTDGSLSEPIAGLPEICVCGQGGLMDVQVHPDYEESGWIYLAYSAKRLNAEDQATGYTSIARAKLDGMELAGLEIIYEAPVEVFSARRQHYGSRIVFDDEGYMFFTIGDRGQRDLAQSIRTPNGKVHRLHDDGRIPTDNPFYYIPEAVKSIWSFGHRNPQGLDRHPETGTLWDAEHGPKGGDELNHVRKGLNFGWPVITYGINYNDTPITDITEKDGMEQPAHYWVPSIATCGIEFYDGDAFPEWANNLFVTSLKFGNIHRIVLDGETVQSEEVFYETGGRPRDVQTGPDGYLYIAIEDAPGRIVRLVPDAG